MKTCESPTGRIETPVQTYQHPDGKQVTLVGVMHIAQQPDYYSTIQEIIDTREAEGAVVHYERVKRSTAQEAEELQPSHEVCNRVRRLRRLARSPYYMVREFNMVKQLDCIDYRPSWENHDATELQIALRTPRLPLLALSAALGVGFKAFDLLSAEERLKVFKQGAVSVSPRRFAGEMSAALGWGLDGSIVHYRNDIALNAYDNLQMAEPDRDAVLFWGAAHLPGLGEGLQQRGFELRKEQFLLAIDVGELAVRSSDSAGK